MTLPISAAWLLGYRAALWTAGGCLGTALVFVTLEMMQVSLPLQAKSTALGNWFLLAQATLIGTIPVGEVLQRLTQALKKVREQCDSLERQDEILRESERRFRTLADTAPVKIAVIDADGSATFLNHGWLEFRGRTLEEELSHGWTQGLHPEDQSDLLKNYFSPSVVATKHKFECRLLRADGEYRFILCSAIARFEPEFAGHVLTGIDITDFKRAEQEAFARAKLETLGSLAAGVAHDFNNLLGGIMALAELAENELPADSRARQELKSIRGLVLRGSDVVRELMIYAGKEAGVFAVVDVSRTIEGMLPLVNAVVSKRARLETDLARKMAAWCR